MNTEQYEEAVRDYEKVYQTEKTSGKLSFCSSVVLFFSFLFFSLAFNTPAGRLLPYSRLIPYRTQASAKERTAGAEEEQKERLLQGAGNRQERHRGRDQESVPQTGPHASPR